MASAAPQKRMVSSFFITLASPHRATVTQQQPAFQSHSAPARDTQHMAVQVSPSDNVPSLRRKKEDHLGQAESYGIADSKERSRSGASAWDSHPQSPKPAGPGSNRGKLQQENRGSAGIQIFFISSAQVQSYITQPYLCNWCCQDYVFWICLFIVFVCLDLSLVETVFGVYKCHLRPKIQYVWCYFKGNLTNCKHHWVFRSTALYK